MQTRHQKFIIPRVWWQHPSQVSPKNDHIATPRVELFIFSQYLMKLKGCKQLDGRVSDRGECHHDGTSVENEVENEESVTKYVISQTVHKA